MVCACVHPCGTGGTAAGKRVAAAGATVGKGVGAMVDVCLRRRIVLEGGIVGNSNEKRPVQCWIRFRMRRMVLMAV